MQLPSGPRFKSGGRDLTLKEKVASVLYKPSRARASGILKFLKRNPQIDQVVLYGRHSGTEPLQGVVREAHKAMPEAQRKRTLFVRIPPRETPQGYHEQATKRFRQEIRKVRKGEKPIPGLSRQASMDVAIALEKIMNDKRYSKILGSFFKKKKGFTEYTLFFRALIGELEINGYKESRVLITREGRTEKGLVKGDNAVYIPEVRNFLLEEYWAPNVRDDFEIISDLKKKNKGIQVVNLHGTPGMKEVTGSETMYKVYSEERTSSGTRIKRGPPDPRRKGRIGHLIEMHVEEEYKGVKKNPAERGKRAKKTLAILSAEPSPIRRTQFGGDYLPYSKSYSVPDKKRYAGFLKNFLNKLRSLE